jgi:hypothetical protein
LPSRRVVGQIGREFARRRVEAARFPHRGIPGLDQNMPRAFRPENPGVGIRGGSVIRSSIEQIVGDLEGQPQDAGVAAEKSQEVRRPTTRQPSRGGGGFEQPAGLAPVNPFERREGWSAGGKLELGCLAADHPRRASGARQLAPDRRGQSARPGGRPPGQDLEGESEQGVAGEKGGRLIESAVKTREAPAGWAVVEARQVVMDQGEAMDELDRASGAERRSGVGARIPSGGGGISEKGERGAEALSSGKHRIAHGRMQAAGWGLGAGEQAVERPIYPGRRAGKETSEPGR